MSKDITKITEALAAEEWGDARSLLDEYYRDGKIAPPLAWELALSAATWYWDKDSGWWYRESDVKETLADV